MDFAQQNANHATVIEDYAAETAVAIKILVNVAVKNQATVQELTLNLREANQQLAIALATITALQENGGGWREGERGRGAGRGGRDGRRRGAERGGGIG